MRRELSPEGVAARLAVLGRIASLPRVDDAARELAARDLSPGAVGARLDELRALDDLARYLHGGRR